VAHPALIDAVRRKTAETAAAVWAEARDAATRRRDESQRIVEQRRAELEQRVRITAEQTLRATLRDAERQSRATRGAARRALAGRLLTLARGCVGQLRDEAYPTRFQGLVAELPDRPWTSVHVNPADVPLALGLFVNCQIVGDLTIGAGLVAVSDGLRVTNTFDQRLAAAWREIQPAVMDDVLDHHARSRSVA
jgi:vacuolar-type H+-ATPase subunit E/Vma4